MSSARFRAGLKDAALFALPALLMACTENATSTEREAARVRTGLITLERSETGDAEVSSSEATARFVQTRGAPDESALKLGGFALALPEPQTCITLQRGSTRNPQPVSRIVLTDVGNVVFTLPLRPDVSITMQSRVIPDFSGLVQGSMYFAGSIPVQSGEALSIGLDGFSAQVLAPERLHVQVSTPQVSEAFGKPVPWILPRRGAAGTQILLEWNSVPESIAFVDVLASEGGPALRCAFSGASEGGRAVLSSDLLGSTLRGHLRFHRITRRMQALREHDTLEVRFDDTLAIPFERP
jgi:hypothetical protein